MTETSCDNIRINLALGETESVADVGHLATCPSCRAEAETMLRLTAALSASARVDPPPGLDARLKSLLAAEPFGLLLRPWLAGGLAMASFVALISALAVGLARTPAAEYGPLLAVGLGSAYLAFSAAAALPLMMHFTRHNTRRAEVRA